MQRTIFGPEHEALRETAHEFLQRNVVPRMEEFLEARGLPRDFWLEAGKQGLLGVHVPDEWGGAGSEDPLFGVVVSEEFAKVSASVASCYGIHSGVVAPYLVQLCTTEQKERWLPRFCTGELVTAIAMTEPSGGSDLAALRTTAVRDGDAWVVNGSKTFITNGYSADLVVVAARTDPPREPVASRCSRSRPGWTASPEDASSTRWARRSRTPPSSSSTTSVCPTPTASVTKVAASST